MLREPQALVLFEPQALVLREPQAFAVFFLSLERILFSPFFKFLTLVCAPPAKLYMVKNSDRPYFSTLNLEF